MNKIHIRVTMPHGCELIVEEIHMPQPVRGEYKHRDQGVGFEGYALPVVNVPETVEVQSDDEFYNGEMMVGRKRETADKRCPLGCGGTFKRLGRHLKVCTGKPETPSRLEPTIDSGGPFSHCCKAGVEIGQEHANGFNWCTLCKRPCFPHTRR